MFHINLRILITPLASSNSSYPICAHRFAVIVR